MSLRILQIQKKKIVSLVEDNLRLIFETFKNFEFYF